MVTGQNLSVVNRGFFRSRKEITGLVVIDFGNFLFGQTFVPCDRKAGVQSEEAVVLVRDHQARELGDFPRDATTRFKHEPEIVIDE